jgi:hypothetical protein
MQGFNRTIFNSQKISSKSQKTLDVSPDSEVFPHLFGDFATPQPISPISPPVLAPPMTIITEAPGPRVRLPLMEALLTLFTPKPSRYSRKTGTLHGWDFWGEKN